MVYKISSTMSENLQKHDIILDTIMYIILDTCTLYWTHVQAVDPQSHFFFNKSVPEHSKDSLL